MNKGKLLAFAILSTALYGCTQQESTGMIEQEAAPFQTFVIDDYASTDGVAVESTTTAISSTGTEDKKELEIMLKEYAPFGLSFDEQESQWYWDGKPVKRLKDVLLSNGEELTSGKFQGVLRNLNGKGDVEVEIIRDYDRLTPQGYGTITEIQVMDHDNFTIVGKEEEGTTVQKAAKHLQTF